MIEAMYAAVGGAIVCGVEELLAGNWIGIGGNVVILKVSGGRRID
jgi:hypothetical protein